MTNPFTLLQPKIYTSYEGKPFKRLNRDFQGTITWDANHPLNSSLVVFNSLMRDIVRGDIRIMIGNVIFFEGFITRSFWGTESNVTNTLNIEAVTKIKGSTIPIQNTTFNKGDLLSTAVPTADTYALKNTYVFPKVANDATDADKAEILNSRAQEIATKEGIGDFTISETGLYAFSKVTVPRVLKARMHILNEKVQFGDMISLDIIPNLFVRPQTTFELKDSYLNILKGFTRSKIPYFVTSSSISFSSSKGASQKVEAQSIKYRNSTGRVTV